MLTPPPLEIVCSPIEHIDASEIINSPTHSMISNSSTIVASNPNPDMDIEQTLTDLEKCCSELIPHMIDMPTLPDLPFCQFFHLFLQRTSTIEVHSILSWRLFSARFFKVGNMLTIGLIC